MAKRVGLMGKQGNDCPPGRAVPAGGAGGRRDAAHHGGPFCRYKAQAIPFAMTCLRFLPAILLALPLLAKAQTSPAASAPTPATPAPGTQQVTEVTEDLDPATGKVIRRTTRTYTMPAGAAKAAPQATTSAGSTAAAPAPAPPAAAADLAEVKVTDAQIAAFLGKKTPFAVATLSGPVLLDAYSRFLEKVRADRHAWKPADWAKASAVLAALNARYEQVRPNLTLDDKLSVRSQQAEYQALRTARQISEQVSNKL